MEVCRVCLANTPEKDIFQLQTRKNGDSKSFLEVFTFCLGVQVNNVLIHSFLLFSSTILEILILFVFRLQRIQQSVQSYA